MKERENEIKEMGIMTLDSLSAKIECAKLRHTNDRTEYHLYILTSKQINM